MEGSPTYPRFLPLGDSALTVEFGDAIAPEINQAVVALDISVNAAELDGIVETVPSFRSLLVCYDSDLISFDLLVDALCRLLARGTVTHNSIGATWHVPVVYDPPYAADLEEVAQRLGLTPARVIELHAEADYYVYMVGFAPGIPYMGGLATALHIPRRVDPRGRLPAGAVVIGGMQASIASVPVPSGWYMLGQTPLRLFDRGRADPFLVRAGDRVRFRRIDTAEYQHLSAMAQADVAEFSRAA